jgi:hypothetical protein
VATSLGASRIGRVESGRVLDIGIRREEGIMTGLLVTVLIGVAAAAGGAGGPPGELAAPARVEAAGKPIDTAVGHAAPFVGDYDGDKVPDLLVGQFGEGLLWIYHNEGTAARPKLAAGVKFKDGREVGRVPTG